VEADRHGHRDLWHHGVSRRRFLAGAGLAGAAALATPLVTARASFGQPGETGTLVVVFLRGGLDGLSVVVPAGDPHLAGARPRIGVPAGALLPLDRGFGLHPALAPLHELWGQGRFTAVPAAATPDTSRSHFQAQDCLERGGAGSGTTEGWLDRVLDAMGPGTTFRAVSIGTSVARSLAGDQAALSLRTVDKFRLAVDDADRHARTTEAIRALYTGIEHPLAADVATTLAGLDTARLLAASEYQAAAEYPEGDFPTGLREIARLVRSDVGLRVASIDVGGWDMHTDIGPVEDGNMTKRLGELGTALGAFATDLGDRLDDVTVVVVSEFGRRVEQNANSGTDHGHGGVMLLLGGGLAGGTVHGNWHDLSPDVLDQGDVPGWNDCRDVLGEVVIRRLGVPASALPTIFPGYAGQTVGVMS
jgi:uncharacterized protein (DUF1501 family)